VGESQQQLAAVAGLYCKAGGRPRECESSLNVAQYSRVAAGKVTSSGVYVSIDGGVNWSRGLAGAPRDVVIDPGDSRVVYRRAVSHR